MSKKILARFSVLLVSLIVSLVIGEVIVRRMGSFDTNGGNFWFNGVHVLPYKLPVDAMQTMISQLNDQSTHRAMYIYDPLVGWTYRAHHTSQYWGPMYQHTTDGIRTKNQDDVVATDSSKIRIEIFGDSFTHGDDVEFKESWGYLLEQNLKQRGYDVEVVNLGLGGGAMDQAYLRWQTVGKRYKPQVVIFGFQEENRLRNVSIIRTIQHVNNGLPYSKPRFILENGNLKLINSPTTTPEQNLQILKNINSWDLLKYERFYRPELYQDHFYLKSRLVGLLYTLALSKINGPITENIAITPGKDEDDLAYAIVENFKKDVVAENTKFFVVDLPTSAVLKKSNTPYDTLMNNIKKDTTVFELPTLYQETKEGRVDSLFKGHYSPKGYKIVADDLTEDLLKNPDFLSLF